MLYAAVRDFFLQQALTGKKIYWIAYSGGLDSHALLSLCHWVRQDYPDITLRAIHVNHQLSPYANQWARHCQKVCADYAIDFFERNVQIEKGKNLSLEEVARDKRYVEFAECLNLGDVLLTAHQQNDQAETVLLQLCRGSGLKGLAAMPPIKSFARGHHARPLLGFTRLKLEQYAKDRHLVWVNDESNNDTKLTRNFLRRDILPLLNERWPAVKETIARSATHCAESQVLLEKYGVTLLKNIENESSKTLSVTKLMQLDEAHQHLILRTWIKQNGYRVPNTKKMALIRQEVLLAGPDRLPCLSWQGAELRRYRDELYIMANIEKEVMKGSLIWNFSHPLILPGIGTLSAQQFEGRGLRAGMQVSVGLRQGGEVMLLPRRGRRTLKHLFQEWNIPPWERDRLPLLFAEEKCIGVVGYSLDEDYLAKPGEMGHQPHLKRS
jgi:tRNA(Ile)-lysidine synthase